MAETDNQSQASRRRRKYRVAVLTLSDQGASGEREDVSGKILQKLALSLPGDVGIYEILPDDIGLIEKRLSDLSDSGELDLILTTGGTGVSPRDVTPDATQKVIEREVPGMAEAMRAASMAKTFRAMISRAVCGVRGQTLIVNLPGSPRGAQENFEVILPVLPHALDKIRGDRSDCAKP